MRIAMMLILCAGLSGCALFLTPDQMHERAQQERFDSCMSKTVGPFGAFQSIEARQHAADTCKGVMQSP